MATFYLSLGSNIDPLTNLQQAVRALRQQFTVHAVSPVYRSPAMGMDAEDFLNAAVAGSTALPALELVSRLRAIENQQGRDRSQSKFSSRTLDLDLLLYDDLVVQSPALRLPHADVHNYAFVLQPLVDIAASVRHPLSGQTLSAMLSDLRQRQPAQFASLQIIADAPGGEDAAVLE